MMFECVCILVQVESGHPLHYVTAAPFFQRLQQCNIRATIYHPTVQRTVHIYTLDGEISSVEYKFLQLISTERKKDKNRDSKALVRRKGLSVALTTTLPSSDGYWLLLYVYRQTLLTVNEPHVSAYNNHDYTMAHFHEPCMYNTHTVWMHPNDTWHDETNCYPIWHDTRMYNIALYSYLSLLNTLL